MIMERWLTVLILLAAGVWLAGAAMAAEKDAEKITDFAGDHSDWQVSGNQYREISLSRIAGGSYRARGRTPVLEVEYDFRGLPGTSGVYLKPQQPLPLEGYPKALGLWLHGDGQGHWLRGEITDAAGQRYPINFTASSPAGLDWTGWGYVEADLPQGLEPPLAITAPIRYMALDGSEKGRGTLLIDEVWAIYSRDGSEDRDPPVVSDATPQGRTASQRPRIAAKIADGPEGTGVNPEALRGYVQGQAVEVVWNEDLQEAVFDLQDFVLGGGTHEAAVYAEDHAGNPVWHRWQLRVENGRLELPSVSVPETAEWMQPWEASVSLPDMEGKAEIHLQHDPAVAVKEARGAEIFGDGEPGRTSLRASAGSGELTLWFRWREPVSGTIQLQLSGGTVELQDGTRLLGTVITETQVSAGLELSWSLVPEPYGLEVTVLDNGGQPVSGALLRVGRDKAVPRFWEKEPAAVSGEDGQVVFDLQEYKDARQIVAAAEHDGRFSHWEEIALPRPRGGSDPDWVSHSWAGDPAVTQAVAFGTGPHVSSAQVRFRPAASDAEDGPWVEQAAESRWVKDGQQWSTIHWALLDGLEPGIEYAYAIRTTGDWIPQGQFRTAPDSPEPFSFLFAADTQDHRFPVWRETLQAAAGRSDDMAFILHGGDIVDDGHQLNQWLNFLEASQPFLRSTPFVPAMGNHDVYGQGRNWFGQFFPYPQEGAPETAVYSLGYGSLRLFVLNSEADRSSMERQAAWLREEVKAAEEPWLAAVLHRAPYNSNPLRSPDASAAVFAPVLEELGMDLVLTAHDHVYMRTKPMYEGEPASGQPGTVYVTGGVAGKKFYPGQSFSYTDVLYAEDVPTYVMITAAESRLEGTAWNLDGEKVDSWSLTK